MFYRFGIYCFTSKLNPLDIRVGIKAILTLPGRYHELIISKWLIDVELHLLWRFDVPQKMTLEFAESDGESSVVTGLIEPHEAVSLLLEVVAALDGSVTESVRIRLFAQRHAVFTVDLRSCLLVLETSAVEASGWVVDDNVRHAYISHAVDPHTAAIGEIFTHRVTVNDHMGKIALHPRNEALLF